LGIHTPLGGLHTDAVTGQVTKFTQFIESAKTLGEWEKTATPSQRKALNQQLGKNFALDALLANWDVVGLSKDNILVDANGIAHRADNGGALLYRAQGSPKGSKFGPEVTELESMRNKSINPSTASVYSHLKDSDIRKQMEHLIANEDKILDAINNNDTKAIIVNRLDYFKKKLSEGYGIEKAATPQGKYGSTHFTSTGSLTPEFKAAHPYAFNNYLNQDLPDEARPPISQKTVASAIKTYTGGGYGPINMHLRQGNENSSTHKNIQKAFAEAPVFKQPVTVRRGMTVYDQAKVDTLAKIATEAMTASSTIQMLGYVSTSTSHGFGGNIRLEIDAIHGIDVKPYSQHQHENELLLNHKSKFKVTSVQQKGKDLHLKLQQLPPDDISQTTTFATNRLGILLSRLLS
jgi:hypothetical protein